MCIRVAPPRVRNPLFDGKYCLVSDDAKNNLRQNPQFCAVMFKETGLQCWQIWRSWNGSWWPHFFTICLQTSHTGCSTLDLQELTWFVPLIVRFHELLTKFLPPKKTASVRRLTDARQLTGVRHQGLGPRPDNVLMCEPTDMPQAWLSCPCGSGQLRKTWLSLYTRIVASFSDHPFFHGRSPTCRCRCRKWGCSDGRFH